MVGDIMYVINYRRNLKDYTAGKVFLCIGIILFIILGYAVMGPIVKRLLCNAEVPAKDIDYNSYTNPNNRDIYYSPTYYYVVNGKNYSCVLNTSSTNEISDYPNIVYYNKSHPNICTTKYHMVAVLENYIILLFPFIFIGFGLFSFIKGRRIKKRLDYLCEHGVLIKDLKYKHNRNNNVLVEYNDKVYYGSNKYLTSELKSSDVIDMLIDPDDDSNYYIDFNIKKSVDK